jgi:hypothetical protein
MLPPNRPDLDSLPLLGAGERGGTYRVVVQKPGYEDWVKTGVVVAEGRCHVVTTTLTARLQRR